MPRRHLLAALVLLFSCGADSAAAMADRLSCASSRDTAGRTVRAASSLQVQLTQAPGRAWLEIDEDGRTLMLDAPAVQLAAPPRLARHGLWLQHGDSVRVSDKASHDSPLRLRIRLFCTDAAARAAATQSLAATAAGLVPGRVNADTLAGLLADFALAQTQTDASLRAYGVHLAAQSLLLAGKSAAAAERFREAEQAWLAVGDRARAMAARTAWMEEYYALGRYDEVIASTGATSAGEDGGAGYYAARLLNGRCLALKYRGRYDEALNCYSDLSEKLVRLAEPLDLANALYNLGNLQRDQGQLDAASDSAEAAKKVASSPEIQYMPPIDVAGTRGRTRLLLADLALRRGTISRAIEEYDAALTDFEAAKAPRWRASTLLQLAVLYGRLGVYSDAYAMWSRGVDLYNFHEAPARIANALLVLSLIQREGGNPRYAAWLAEKSAQQYQSLGMQVEQESSRLVQIRALVDAGDSTTAGELLAQLPGRDANAVGLAASAIALARQQPDKALTTLDSLPAPKSLADQLDQELLRATALQAQGDDARALALVEAALARRDRVMHASANALLRLLLWQRSEPLRQHALSWRLEQRTDAPDLDALIRLLPYAPLPAANDLSRRATRQGSAFDTSLARDLLLGQAERTSNPALPSLLAQADGLAAPQPTAPTLAKLQAQLPRDTALFVLLCGTDHAASLWITHESARLQPIAAPALLRELTQRLAEAVSDASTPTHEVTRQAQALRKALWPQPLPRNATRLYVLAGAVTEDIAWPVLPDDDGTALVESRDLSLVYLGGDEPVPASAPARLTIAIASQRGNRSRLSHLDAAASEPRLIAAAYPGLSLDTLDGSERPIKAALIDTLAQPGTWVHISAHGMTDSGYLGRSGLWLDDADNSGLPQFLSVLDLFDDGIRAALVVLNACDLGGGQQRSTNTLVFADTLVRLGARNVVAAQWPVSDNASALWVPAFYAALAGSPRLDPARALRQGQLQLVRSRAYRHPFYWASLLHIYRLPVISNVL